MGFCSAVFHASKPCHSLCDVHTCHLLCWRKDLNFTLLFIWIVAYNTLVMYCTSMSELVQQTTALQYHTVISNGLTNIFATKTP